MAPATTCLRYRVDEAENLHGHHIVMKGNKYPENAQARRILCKHGIDPYCGCENLAITKNWCHSKKYAERVKDFLSEVKNSKTKVTTRLAQLAREHHDCAVEAPEGKVNPKTDE